MVLEQSRPPRGTSSAALAPLPAVTGAFWLVKILTTGAGETGADYLMARSVPLAALASGLALVVALVVQLRAPRYTPVRYWAVVSLLAVFGTVAADVVHDVVGLSYVVTSLGYAAATAAVFALWRVREGTIDVHSVTTLPRQLFYWAAVAATFALGTAVGDLSAMTLGLGFGPSAVVYGALIVVPAVAWWRFGLPATAAFWSAYVLTRPLGASIADWLSKPVDWTGRGLGDGPVTLVLAAAIAVAVAWFTWSVRRSVSGSSATPRR